MRLEILGPLRVRPPGGTARELTGRRARELLAVLVQLRGTPVAAEALLELVGDGVVAAPGTVHTWGRGPAAR